MRTSLRALSLAMCLLSGLSHGAPTLDVAILDYAARGLARPMADAPGHDQIIEAIQKRYGAKVVRVTEITVSGRPALQLRLLSDQRVWTIVVDAASGQVLSGG